MVRDLEAPLCGKCLWINVGSLFKWHFPGQDREAYKFQTLRKVMYSILESRRELLGATMTQDQTTELQMVVVSKIDWGNR